MTILEQNFLEAVTRYCRQHSEAERSLWKEEVKVVDWEQRRYEIARDLYVTREDYDAKTAIKEANALIKELKKKV